MKNKLILGFGLFAILGAMVSWNAGPGSAQEKPETVINADVIQTRFGIIRLVADLGTAIAGPPGKDGSTILSGTSVPGSGQGVDGDYYIDTIRWEIYGPKVIGAWPAARSIIGPQGLTGASGERGPPGIDGTQGLPGSQGIQGPPGADSAVPGPKGDKGDSGNQGIQGIQGLPGADSTVPGPSGPQGNQGIQGIQGPAGPTVGYAIAIHALTSSPTDAQTVYFGMLPKAPTTTANISKVYVRKAGTIKIAEIYCYSGTAGTAEAWSLYIRKNSTTDTLIATLSVATSERIFTNSVLNIAVAAGDYIEIKGIQPTWVTNPLTTIYGGYIYLE